MEYLDKTYSGIWDKGGGEDEQGGGRAFIGDPEGDFRKYWGWYCTVDELTGGDMFKEKELYAMPVISVLNRIAYLKEKNFVLQQKLMHKK